MAAYTALNVRGMAGGGIVQGPGDGGAGVEGDQRERCRRATRGRHDYSEGAVQVSRGGGRGNSHTLLVYLDEGGYWLVDFTRGVG